MDAGSGTTTTKQNDLTTAPTVAPAPAPAAAPTVAGPGAQQLKALLTQGAPAPAAVAKLVAAYPAEQAAMMTILQQAPGLGNSYVQQVIAATSAAPAAPTKAAPTPAPTTGPTKAAPTPAPTPAVTPGVSIDKTGALVVAGKDATDTSTLTTNAAGTTIDASTALKTTNGLTATASGELAPNTVTTGANTVTDPITGKTTGQDLAATGKLEVDDVTANNTLKTGATADTSQHKFTGTASDTAKVGTTTITGDTSVTDADNKTSEKFDAGVAGSLGSVKADGGLDQSKGVQNGGLQLVGTGGLDAGVEMTHTDATAGTPAAGKKKATPGTTSDLNTAVNAGYTNTDVKVEGTGQEDAQKGTAGAGVTVTDQKTGALKGDNAGVSVLDTKGDIATTVSAAGQAGDNALSGKEVHDGTKGTDTVTLADNVTAGAAKGLKVGETLTNTGGLIGTNTTAGYNDAAGNTTSIGVTTDHTKGDAITASEAIKTGALAGTTITNSTGITKAGVTETVDAKYQNTAAGVTAENKLGYDPTNGLGDTASIEKTGTTKNGINYDAGATATVATKTGVAVDAHAGADKQLNNGVIVAGGVDASFTNGVAGGGASIGAEKGEYGGQLAGMVGPTGVTVAGQVETPVVIIGVVATDGLITRITVQLPGNHPIANTALTVAGDVAVAAIDPAGFGVAEIEKIALHGAPAGIDKLIALAGSGRVEDPSHAVANAVLVLTPDDLKYLDDMKLTKGGKVDGTIEPELFLQRVKDSPLNAAQQAALAQAYKVASANIKHAKVTNESGVSQVYDLVQKSVKDPQAYATLLDSHPDDMLTMLDEIVISNGFGLPFANSVAQAAGILDLVVQKPDGSIAFAPPVTEAAPTPAPTPAPVTPAAPTKAAPTKTAPTATTEPTKVITAVPTAAPTTAPATTPTEAPTVAPITTTTVTETTTTPTSKTTPTTPAPTTKPTTAPAPAKHWYDIFK